MQRSDEVARESRLRLVRAALSSHFYKSQNATLRFRSTQKRIHLFLDCTGTCVKTFPVMVKSGPPLCAARAAHSYRDIFFSPLHVRTGPNRAIILTITISELRRDATCQRGGPSLSVALASRSSLTAPTVQASTDISRPSEGPCESTWNSLAPVPSAEGGMVSPLSPTAHIAHV